jgi:GT2 family glycosyltransferase
MIITAVIPIHNGLPNIIDCINSLKLQRCDDFDLRIIVVDDGSTDNSSDEICKGFRGIEIITGNGNLWWTGAIAAGSRKALDDGADYVFWINHDDILETTALKNLLEFSERHRNVISACGVSYNNTSERILCGYSLHYLKWYAKPQIIQLSNFLLPSFVLRCDLNGGHGILIPKSLFAQDKAIIRPNIFPHYFGDFDFYFQARKLGYYPYIVGNALVYNDPTTCGLLGSHRVQNIKQTFPYLFSRRSMNNLRDRPLMALLDFPHGLNLIWALLFVLAPLYCAVFYSFRKRSDFTPVI